MSQQTWGGCHYPDAKIRGQGAVCLLSHSCCMGNRTWTLNSEVPEPTRLWLNALGTWWGWGAILESVLERIFTLLPLLDRKLRLLSSWLQSCLSEAGLPALPHEAIDCCSEFSWACPGWRERLSFCSRVLSLLNPIYTRFTCTTDKIIKTRNQISGEEIYVFKNQRCTTLGIHSKITELLKWKTIVCELYLNKTFVVVVHDFNKALKR